MKIAVTGATGLIGTALCQRLRQDGHHVLAVTRRHTLPPLLGSLERVPWEPDQGSFDAAPLEGVDAVVNLAGASVASPWTAAHKDRIRKSRVEGTRLLVEGLKSLHQPPAALVSASAVGFYGDRGDEEIHENSSPGTGFLAEVCQGWETEALRASGRGIRTACLRIGIVLSTRGGALGKMLPPFKLGLGGRVGSGRQWMSWIHIDDVAGMLRFLVRRPEASGAFNGTAPRPVRNAGFAKALGRALGRPAFLPAPAFAMKLLLGEMAQVLLLEGQKVLPRRMEELGYRPQYPDLGGALQDLVATRK
ncbi:MAG: TIGR01777 family oxidoreductase [Acidobacteriota bacterium]